MNFGGFCFLEDFSGHFFPPHKNEEKKSGEKIREKSGGPKIIIREKSILPRTGPKSFSSLICSENPFKFGSICT